MKSLGLSLPSRSATPSGKMVLTITPACWPPMMPNPRPEPLLTSSITSTWYFKQIHKLCTFLIFGSNISTGIQTLIFVTRNKMSHLTPIRPDGASISFSLSCCAGCFEGCCLKVCIVMVAWSNDQVDCAFGFLENADGLLVADLRVERLPVDRKNLNGSNESVNEERFPECWSKLWKAV